MSGDPDSLLLVSRIVLAVPLAVSGLRKLADPIDARHEARDWGVPAKLVNVTVSTLTLAEIAIAVGLVWGGSAWVSTVLALGCLGIPAVAAALRMARRGASAAGMSVIVRAAMLAIPATVVLWHGSGVAGPDLVAWLSGLSIGQQVTVVAGTAVYAAWSGGARLGRPLWTRSAKPVVEPEEETVHARTAASLVRPSPELTIGMATYDDFDGVYFTLQALRLYQDLDNTELLVVDNYGCQHTRELVCDWTGGTYLLANEVVGTAVPKDLVFRTARGSAVLCCDSHVLFAPGVISRLKRFYRDNPSCRDLLQGPLVYDDGRQVSSHFDPVWRGQMWGTWATDPRAYDVDGEPFEIPMQGLGVFSCRTEAWLGFNPEFRGFGGEEGYIHEKFRRAGRRCLCLPWLRWTHRFGRPRGTPYPLTVEDKLRNYVLGHAELGLDLGPVLAHFSQYLPADRIAQITDQAVQR